MYDKKDQEFLPSDAGQPTEQQPANVKGIVPKSPILSPRIWRKGRRINGRWAKPSNNRKETKGRLRTRQRIQVMAVVMENGKPKVGLDGKPIKRPTGEMRTIYHYPNPNR